MSISLGLARSTKSHIGFPSLIKHCVMDFEICCVFLVAQNVEKAICISNIIIFFGSEVLGSASVLLVSEGMRLH